MALLWFQKIAIATAMASFPLCRMRRESAREDEGPCRMRSKPSDGGERIGAVHVAREKEWRWEKGLKAPSPSI